MWLSSVLNYWGSKNEAEEEKEDKIELEKALQELDVEKKDESDLKDDNVFITPKDSEQVLCKTGSGKITDVAEALIIIDNRICVHRDMVDFFFEVGKKVEYTYLEYGKDNIRVCKVKPLVEDEWSYDGNEAGEGNEKVSFSAKRCVTCQVEKKDKGTLHLRAENNEKLTVKMEDVSIDFIPMKGDWLSCEVTCEVDENKLNYFGVILSTDKIKPARNRLCNGEVTLWREDVGAGIIMGEIFFTKEACSPGYVPHIGDKVLIQCIESTQGSLTWRAVNILPAANENGDKTTNSTSQNSSAQQNALYASKEGISVKLLNDNLVVKLGSTLNLEVEVKNSATEVHTLTQYKMRFIGSQPQISIVYGPKIPYTLEPDSVFVFSLKATASFIGKSSESLILSFNDKFHIGCAIDLVVDDDKLQDLKKSVRTNGSYQRKNVDLGPLIPTKTGFFCPGIKPIKPPPFIPVQLMSYAIPKKLYEVFLDEEGNDRRKDQIAEKLEEYCPEVNKPLDRTNYKKKFCTLLHLEELSVSLRMRRFNEDRAVFKFNGEYFILEVPHLSENRPSLIVGDRVYAKNPDVSHNEYEGFIHKTQYDEVWLKFGQQFHSVYAGNSFQVKFVHSRTTFQRSHQAVVNVYDKEHLGVDWLFPSHLKNLKPPQVIFTESEDDLNCDTNNSEEKEKKELNEENKTTESKTPEIKRVSSSKLDKLRSLITNDCNEKPDSEEKDSDESVNVPNAPVSSNNSDDSAVNTKELKNQENNDVKANSLQQEVDSIESTLRAYHHYRNSKPSMIRVGFDTSGRGYGSAMKEKKKEVKACPVSIREKISWFNPRLNNRQKFAVKNILKGEARPLPYIIFGPPGTGKTVTMVETILQIYSMIPDCRILIATPSNSAADLVTDRILANIENLLPGQLVRLVSFSYVNDKRLPPHLIPYCALVDYRDTPEKSEHDIGAGSIKICSRDGLGRHKITIGTCNSIGQMYVLGFPVGHFTHVFVDESGQASEPEVLIPLGFLHQTNGQAILAGDPLQLGPVITSPIARTLGLDISLVARFLLRYPYAKDNSRFPTTNGYDPRLVTKLVDNYRSVPELLSVSSNLFYNSELIPHVSTENSFEGEILSKMKDILNLTSKNNPHLPPSLIFHGVQGENFQETDSPSWFNPEELIQVVIYLRHLYDVGLKEDHIGIITPYQKQASKIRSIINDMKLPMPKVGSVEEFQGQERYVILVSLVRSVDNTNDCDIEYSLGFLRNPFRVNVSMSRARALCIVMGNPHLLGHEHFWKNVVKFAAKIGGYTGCSYPRFLENKEDDNKETEDEQ